MDEINSTKKKKTENKTPQASKRAKRQTTSRPKKTNWAIVMPRKGEASAVGVRQTTLYIHKYSLSRSIYMGCSFEILRKLPGFPPWQLRLVQLINMPSKRLVKLQLSPCLRRKTKKRWIIQSSSSIHCVHHDHYLFRLSAKISMFLFALSFCVFVNKKLAQIC